MDHNHQFPPDLNYEQQQHQHQWIAQQPPQQQSSQAPQHSSYYPHNASPAHDFSAYSFAPPSSSMPSHPYAAAHPSYAPPHQQAPPQSSQRAHSAQLGSLMMPPQWPPNLVGHAAPGTPIYPATAGMHRAPDGLATPHLASHQPGPTPQPPTPRRTLTDADRRRMCLYHEDHPHKKQTEIGEIFGVERSTVSKVLRQKEKYLAMEDGGQSPIKRSRPKIPDLDRTLAKWVQNQKEKGTLLTDETIKNQARTFLAASGATPDGQLQIESATWLDKFKQKNNIGQSNSRKVSSQGESQQPPPNLSNLTSAPTSTANSGSHISPGPPDLKHHHSFGSRDSLQRNSLVAQTNTPLSTASTEQSANHGATSPIFSPDVTGNPAAYYAANGGMPVGASRTPSMASSRAAAGLCHEGYLSSPPNTLESHTPAYHTVAVSLESPLSDMPPPLLHHFGSSSSLARPSGGRRDSRFSNSASPSMVPQTVGTPTITDARLGLETAMNFLQQNTDPIIEAGDLYAMNRVMDRLRVRQRSMDDSGHDRGHETPSVLHRIAEVAYDGHPGQ